MSFSGRKGAWGLAGVGAQFPSIAPSAFQSQTQGLAGCQPKSGQEALSWGAGAEPLRLEIENKQPRSVAAERE